jgi:sirohydrochlorin ferrochelatase
MQRPSRAGEFHGRLLDAVLAAPDLRGTDIIVAMQFLFPGRHAAPDGDIAAICSKAREQHPERALRLTTLVGAHPAFATLVADRAAGGSEIL